jgi:hypothetical protein
VFQTRSFFYSDKKIGNNNKYSNIITVSFGTWLIDQITFLQNSFFILLNYKIQIYFLQSYNGKQNGGTTFDLPFQIDFPSTAIPPQITSLVFNGATACGVASNTTTTTTTTTTTKITTTSASTGLILIKIAKY